MTTTDRFAAFRPSPEAGEDLFAHTLDDRFSALSHAVPPLVGHENPQKTAMSHVSHVSHDENTRAEAGATLTTYLVALMLHRNIEQVDPAQAAKKYSLREDWCRAYLDDEKRRRRAKK